MGEEFKFIEKDIISLLPGPLDFGGNVMLFTLFKCLPLALVLLIFLKIFFNSHTLSGLCTSEPRPVVDLRKEASNVDEFDKEIEKAINLYTPNPEIDYPDINIVWSKFQNMFASIGGLLDYWPVYRDFHYQILQEMYDDNVMYAEFRTGVGGNNQG